MRISLSRGIAALRRGLIVAAVLIAVIPGATAASASTVSMVVNQVASGAYGNKQIANMRLDAAGNPVIVFFDINFELLQLMHCNDALCAGNDETVQTLTSIGLAVLRTYLEIGPDGNPVIAVDDGSHHLVIHCDAPDCLPGGDSMVTLPGTSRITGMVLDALGNPVLSLTTGPEIVVMHCDDLGCEPGGDTSNTAATTPVGIRNSDMTLDAQGNPVIIYDYTVPFQTTYPLKLVRCNDPACASTSSADITLTSIELWWEGMVLAVDGQGNPVVTIQSEGGQKVIHCDDPLCAPSPGDTLQMLDTGLPGIFSLTVDASENPVILYSRDNSEVRRAHCGDPACLPSGVSIQSLDVTENTSSYPATGVDSGSRVALLYLDNSAGSIRLVSCDDQSCAPGSKTTTELLPSQVYGDGGTTLFLGADGNPVIAYRESYTSDLLITRCNDPVCAGDDEASSTILKRAFGTSIKLDANGNPVVTYNNLSPVSTPVPDRHARMELLHCDDPLCAPGGDTTTVLVEFSPDDLLPEFYGPTALTLDAGGNPVIAYTDNDAVSHLIHCNDPLCSPGGDTSNVLSVFLGGMDIVLDADGNPVIAFGDDRIMLLHCDDPACAAGGDTTAIIDTSVNEDLWGQALSVRLAPGGNPFLTYVWYDASDHPYTRVAHCSDPLCTQTITRQNLGGSAGGAITLGSDGTLFMAAENTSGSSGRLWMLRCTALPCSAANALATMVDANGDVGANTSILLDAYGHPVISYFDATTPGIRLARETQTDTLTVGATGEGSGTMTAGAAIPDCAWDGAHLTGDCSETAMQGTAYSITANPDSASLFDGWTGCDGTSGAHGEICAIALDGDKTVSAAFSRRVISLSDTSHDFGSLLPGQTSPPFEFTIHNTGDDPLTVTGLDVTSDFSAENHCTSALDPDGTCTFDVTFHPTTPGAKSGSVTVGSNAPGDAPVVTLTGYGLNSLPAPALKSPRDASSAIKLPVKFAWKSVKGVKGYHVRISQDGAFQTGVIEGDATKSTFSAFLPEFGVYYWQVASKDAAGVRGGYSAPFSFTYTLNKSPKNGSLSKSTTPKFAWQAVRGATYELEVYTDPNDPAGSHPFDIQTGLKKPSFKVLKTSPLARGQTYFWRVRTAGGQWTPAWSFTVK